MGNSKSDIKISKYQNENKRVALLATVFSLYAVGMSSCVILTVGVPVIAPDIAIYTSMMLGAVFFSSILFSIAWKMSDKLEEKGVKREINSKVLELKEEITQQLTNSITKQKVDKDKDYCYKLEQLKSQFKNMETVAKSKDELIRELEVFRTAMEGIGTETEALESKFKENITEFERKLLDKDKEIENLEGKISEFGELNSQKESIIELENKLLDKDKEIENLEGKISGLEERNSQQTSIDADSYNELVDSQKKEIERLELALEKSIEKKGQASSEASAARALKQSYEKRVKSAEEGVEKLKTQLDTKNIELALEKQNRESLFKQNKELLSQNKELSNKNKELLSNARGEKESSQARSGFQNFANVAVRTITGAGGSKTKDFERQSKEVKITPESQKRENKINFVSITQQNITGMSEDDKEDYYLTAIEYSSEIGISMISKNLSKFKKVIAKHGSPLVYATKTGNVTSFDIIVKYHMLSEDSEKALFQAVAISRLEILHKLVQERGLGIDTVDSESKESIVMKIARVGNIENFREMLSKEGYSYDIIKYWVNKGNDEGQTPLMEAVRLGHEKMVRLLLECGADIYKQNKQSAKAIDYIEYNGSGDPVNPNIHALLRKNEEEIQEKTREQLRIQESYLSPQNNFGLSLQDMLKGPEESFSNRLETSGVYRF